MDRNEYVMCLSVWIHIQRQNIFTHENIYIHTHKHVHIYVYTCTHGIFIEYIHSGFLKTV